MDTKQIIDALKLMDVDGDTMQYILREVHLESQLLKQLVMTSNDLDLTNAIEERLSFNESDSLKDFWREVYNREGELRSMAKRVWDDIHNNDTLIYNNFEDYYKTHENNQHLPTQGICD